MYEYKYNNDNDKQRTMQMFAIKSISVLKICFDLTKKINLQFSLTFDFGVNRRKLAQCKTYIVFKT